MVMKVFLKALLATALLALSPAAAVEVGDKIATDVDLHFGFPPESINLSQRIKNKKVILVGLPGAFTPTWSTRQVPGYLANEDALKKLGIDEVIVFCVNDGAVMNAWAIDQKVPEDSIIKLMGDPYAILTEKLEMELTHSGPKSVGLINRCKRHALYVVDGKVKIVRVAEKEDDPAGDEFPDITLADSMIDAIKELRKKSPKEEL